MTPRKPSLLPFLQRLPSGRLRYTRRVPKELREHFGNRGYSTVLMPPDVTDPKDKRLLKAWNEAAAQVEVQMAEAKAKQAAEEAIEPVSALTPKDIAGIAAEPWRQIREAMAEGKRSQEMDEKARQTLMITLRALTGDQQPA